MREIGAFEAKSKLGQLLDWVEAGEEVVITRRGKVVAKLVPPGRQHRSCACRRLLRRGSAPCATASPSAASCSSRS